ncbi:methyltransferase domain-containing protein, partial [bacterium]|nr:methyltransferase domain-containing protein [bacterium]
SATQMGSQVSFFENGLLVFTVPDRLSAEESVHYTLLEHPCPRKVLLIGGGLGGGIRETLRHPTITNVEYLELDPSIVQMAQKLLPDEHILHLKDPRVHIHNMDARRYIKLSKKSFDIVILNLPNPYTAQLNRFYTLEFFTEVNKILRPGGVFSLHVTSSENAIGPELSNFLSTIHATLSAKFPDIVTLPGETARFIVSNKPGLLTSDPQILVSRLKNRKLETKYVREYRFPYDMLKERRDYLQSNLHSVPQNQLNRDFKPVGYFYDTILWATTYSANFKKLFLAFARIRPYSFVGFFLLTVLILIGISWIRRGKTTLFSTGILYSIIGIGFTEISLVVILILGFQVLYGHV